MVIIKQRFIILLISVFLCLFFYGSLCAITASSGTDEEGQPVSVVQLLKQSRDLAAANDLSRALQFARKATLADPAYGEGWKQLGRIQMLQGNYRDAVSSLKIAGDLKPGDRELQSWLLRSEIAAQLASGRFDEATITLEKILKSNPDNEEVRQMLASVYAERASHEKGSGLGEMLAKVVALDPERGGTWRDLGWLLFSQGKYDEAIQAWDRALQDKSLNRKALIEQAIAALAEQKQLDLAKATFQRWQPKMAFLELGLRYIELNRLIAAREILNMAWDEGENRIISGLYLAFTESRSGACHQVYEHLRPFFEGVSGVLDKKQIEVYVSTMHTCSFEANLLPLIKHLENILVRLPEYKDRIIDIYEKAANERRAVRDYGNAYDLFLLVLKYDPNRVSVWPTIRELAKNTGHEKEVGAILEKVAMTTSSVAVKEGIEGLMAEEKGDLNAAISHFRRSLSVVPHQPELRYFLFNDLVAVGAIREAEEEADWFRLQVNAGNATVKSFLGNTLNTLGRTEDALMIWQELYLTMPDNEYYALETSRALFALCRAEEAIQILEQAVAALPTVRAFELLAEIESALGRPLRAFEVSTSGLAQFSSQTLLRIRAESADTLRKADPAEDSSRMLLKADPGNVSMNLILARSLDSQKLTDDAIAQYMSLLSRNPSFLPSIVQLRNLYSSKNEPEKALSYATQLSQQRPWDPYGGQLLSLSQIEADDFPTPLKYLRAQAAEDIEKATPILLFRDIQSCAYGGRNNVRQVTSYIEKLSAEGYRFVTPYAISNATTGKSVAIFIVDTKPSVVEKIDEALRRTGGQAVYAFDPDALRITLPGKPSPEMLKAMKSGGRWILASSGSSKLKPVNTSNSGTTGNALTHRIFENGRYEDYSAMKDRLDRFFSAQTSSSDLSPIFVYPQGDYGQISLDTDIESIEVLKASVKRHFQYAVAGDDKGFVVPGFDPIRMPGRYVPAEWSPDDAVKHLRHNNPYVRARLELAKALYLYSQHERANAWFKKAEELGANPEETNFFWGSNAHIEGDIPTALEKLRKAHQMNPESERNLNALQRSERKKAVLLDGYIHGWNDSDDRSYSVLGAYVSGYITDTFMVEVFGDRNKWSRSGMGYEYGNRFGAGTRWYFKEEYWLDATLWHMNIPGINDYFGGSASVHIPSEAWGGYFNLWGNRKEVDTVEAVRKKIMENNFGAQTYKRIYDEWDLYADLTYTNYTDNNNSFMLDSIFMKRLHEWPFLGAGVRLRFGDSSKDPPEYWSPQDLQQYEFYAATRGEYGRFRYSVSAEAGVADDNTSGWRFVWGGRADLVFMVTPDFALRGRFSHRETPDYRRNEWLFGISYRF